MLIIKFSISLMTNNYVCNTVIRSIFYVMKKI